MATNNKPKIIVSGSCPTFDAAELQRRQDLFHNAYHETSLGCELVSGDIPLLLLTKVIEKVGQGYTLNTRYPVSMGEMSYQCRMNKTDAMQKADLIAGNEDIKQKYIIEIEVKRAEFKERLKQQLLQKVELDEEKKMADKRNKLLADINKQVEDTFAPLGIPD